MQQTLIRGIKRQQRSSHSQSDQDNALDYLETYTEWKFEGHLYFAAADSTVMVLRGNL